MPLENKLLITPEDWIYMADMMHASDLGKKHMLTFSKE